MRQFHAHLDQVRQVHDHLNYVRQVYDHLDQVRQVHDHLGQVRQVRDQTNWGNEFCFYIRVDWLKICFFLQAQIRQAAQKFSDIQAVSEVESILTVYLKDTGAKFQSKYVDLLTPITRLSLTRNEKYTVFQTILERFVPVESDNSDSALYHLSRLLLLYHDPHLCNHIDSLKINFSDFSTSWFR